MTSLVGILVASDTDLPGVQEACDVLTDCGVSYVQDTLPKDATSEVVLSRVAQLEADGCSVYIFAGEANAPMAGEIAAHTTRPVIAVPLSTVPLSPDALSAALTVPSLLPVATVAVNGIKNAVLLALQMLSSVDTTLRAKVANYKHTMAEEVRAKNTELEKIGVTEYVTNMRV